MGKNRIKTVRAGRLVTAVCYAQALPGDPPEVREAKRKPATQAKQLINHRYSWQRLEQLLAANFGPGDLFSTLTFDRDHLPESIEEARRQVQLFIRRLQRDYKKRGKELKYIYTVERGPDRPGGAGRLHAHIIVNADESERDMIVSKWKNGAVYTELLLEDIREGYEARARYMVKERAPDMPGRQAHVRGWTPSLNLDKPVTTSELVPDTQTITAPPGAYILERREDSNSWGMFKYLKYILPERDPPTVRWTRKNE